MALSLGTLTLMILSLALPSSAMAQYDEGYVRPYNQPVPYVKSEIVYQPAVYQETKVVNNTSNTNKSTTTTKSSVSNTSDKNEQNSNQTVSQKYGSLAANAAYGSDTFAPSGLAQWIMLAILILIIIILARKIFGATERYENSPLKHS